VSRGSLVVFAKQPVPGAVKTRLSPPLSSEEAAELYRAMLADVLVESARAARAAGLDPVLAVHPGRAARELVDRAPAPFRAVAQCGPGLAQRMAWALGEAAAAAGWPVLLRGSDSPALSAEAICAAAEALARSDLVIVPDRDGGYSLVGLRRPAPGLFDHSMSTDRVENDTLMGAKRIGLSSVRLDPSFDIDTIADLRHLAEGRTRGLAPRCPRTLRYLDERDLWRHLEGVARPTSSH